MRWPAAFFVGWIILGIDVGVATSLSPGQRALPSFALPFLVLFGTMVLFAVFDLRGNRFNRLANSLDPRPARGA